MSEGGDPTLERCKIRDGKQSGVAVKKAGCGTFIDCEIHGNASSGIDVIDRGVPTLLVVTLLVLIVLVVLVVDRVELEVELEVVVEEVVTTDEVVVTPV